MKKYLVLIISFCVLCIGTIVLTSLISMQMNRYSEKKLEISESMNAETRLGNVKEWIPEPFNWTSDDVNKKHKRLENEADDYYAKGMDYALYLLILVVLFAAVNIIAYRKSKERARMYGFAMVFASLSFFYLGLMTPFIEISAYKDNVELNMPVNYNFDEGWLTESLGWGEIDEEIGVGVEGRVYFLYQNKSVLKLIKLLWNGNNILVAMCIVCFSILFPVVKLIASAIVLLKPEGKIAGRTTDMVSKMGKWSMADVFVASVFLALFSISTMNVGADTDSNTLIGAYFWLAFVIFSIFSSRFIKKAMAERLDDVDFDNVEKQSLEHDQELLDRPADE